MIVFLTELQQKAHFIHSGPPGGPFFAASPAT
jgi:hypothetical protein